MTTAELSGDRLDTLLAALFGSVAPSRFVRFRMADELAQVKQWSPVLKDVPVAAVKDLVPQVEGLIKRCEAALKAQHEASAALQAFRVHTHAVLVEKVNGQRHALAGDAKKQAFDPRGGIEASEGLFRASERTKAAQVETVETVKADIAEVEAALSLLKERLAGMVAQQEAEAQAEALRQAQEKKISELLRVQQETESQLKTLRAAVGKGKQR